MIRRALLLATLALGFVLQGSTTSAQEAARIWIQRVTVDASAETLTIAGTGLAEVAEVTFDGHVLTVLPGASSTQLVVVVPAATLATPGTYRLTLADASRRLDVFEVTLTPTGAEVGPRAVVEDSGAPWNTTIGYQSLNSLTSGVSNLAAGYQALFANSSGSFNTATGTLALYSTTSGSRNTAHGLAALYGNLTGSDHTAVGYRALYSGEGLVGNTALGSQALNSNTGSYNTAVGKEALASNGPSLENTAVGYQALNSGSASGNTAVGSFVLHASTGSNNTAMGRQALLMNGGSYNAAFGAYALGADTTASSNYNVAVGYSALRNNTPGSLNTAVGAFALTNANGCCNTALGNGAGAVALSGNHNIHLGSSVEGTGQDTNLIRIGNPYVAGTPPTGQNRAFIAGIRGTTVSGATPVGVTADGQLGMADRLGAGLGYGCGTCYQNGTIELYNPGTGDMTLQSGQAYRLLLNPQGGNIGLGVATRLGAGLGYGCTTCYQQGTIELYNPGTGNLTIQGGSSYDLLLNPYGGHVGIGTTNAQYPLHLGNGAHVTAGGVWTNASSRALKDDITPLTLERAQAAFVALAPVEYVYKADPSERQVGFIAEDVPALVAQNDRASLSPMDLVAVLTKVVQAQQAQLTALQGTVAALQTTVTQQGETIAAWQTQRPPQR
jgi:hypothetical protein